MWAAVASAEAMLRRDPGCVLVIYNAEGMPVRIVDAAGIEQVEDADRPITSLALIVGPITHPADTRANRRP
jgi:hypothetical protein